MIGLFHSDWLGCQKGPAESPISHSWEKERRKNPASPPTHYRGELRVDFTGFLDSAEAHVT
jgi:hypothetical protein